MYMLRRTLAVQGRRRWRGSRLLRLLPLATLLLAAAAHRTVAQARPDSVELVIAATTDDHGRLRSWDYYANTPEPARGLSRLASIVDSLRAANPGRVLLLGSGDLLQGNPLAYVAARVSRDATNPIIAAMNVMRYDAAAIGNHEFNYGVPYLNRAVRQARFPFLSANTVRAGSGSPAYARWTMLTRAGVKVAVVGATTPGVNIWDADNVRAAGITLGDVLPSVRTAVSEARRAGADVVVLALHSGLNEPSSYDTVSTGVASENVAATVARAVPGIDLITYGHSHKENAGQVIGQTLLMQPKNWATSLGVARLTLVRGGGRWRVAAKRSELIPASGHAELPAVLAVTDRAHRATVAYATTPIGSTPDSWRADSARLRDTPITDFILEVERKAAGADLASGSAFDLGVTLGPGPITVAQLARLYPYDNTLRAVRISGKQLRDYLEFSSRYYPRSHPEGAAPVTDPTIPGYNFDMVSGVGYTLDLDRPLGERVTSLTFRGKAVQPTDTFTMAVNNYRQTGGGGYAMLRGAPLVYDRQLEIRQLLIDEVRRRGVIRANDYYVPNWRIIHSGATQTGVAPAAAIRTGSTPLTPASSGTPSLLRIIATNDFHGALEARPDRGVLRGGAPSVARAIDRARSECGTSCVTILLDGGDMFQGTPASNLAFGKPVVDYYNAIGYAAAALGNHEFDFGVPALRARMRDAHYGIFAANVRNSDGTAVPWLRGDTLITRGPLRIGVVGVATVLTPTTTRARNVAGLEFLDPAPVVSARVAALRARGANMVIVVAHAGAMCDSTGRNGCEGEIVKMASALTAKVDAIVSGHTHSLVSTVVNGIPIVQARSRGQALGIIDIPITGHTASGAATLEVRDVGTDTLPPLPAIDSLTRRALAAVAPLVNRPVTTIAADYLRNGRQQYALGNLIADAQRWAGQGDVAVMNTGGIRADLRAGPASYGTLFEVQPFANTLYAVRASGAALRSYLEKLVARSQANAHVSGVTITYDSTAAPGSRLRSVRMADGKPLLDSAIYTVIMNDFMVTGGDGLALSGGGAQAKPLGIIDLDALIDYLKTRPTPIVAPSGKRILTVPAGSR